MDNFEVKINGIFNSADDFLTEIFEEGNRPYLLLKNAIVREFRPNGSPDIKQMKIDRIKYHDESGKGSFRVVLDINYSFGCEDLLVEKNNETSEWTFAVDDNRDVITFYGSPYIDSRSTADEF